MVFNVNVGFGDLTAKKDGKGKPCALFLGDTVMVNEVSPFPHVFSFLCVMGSRLNDATHKDR